MLDTHPIFSPAETTTTLGVPHPFRVLCGKGGIADARITTSQIRAQHELEGTAAFRLLNSRQNMEVALATGRSKSTYDFGPSSHTDPQLLRDVAMYEISDSKHGVTCLA